MCPRHSSAPGGGRGSSGRGRGARAAEPCHWVGPRAAGTRCSCPLRPQAASHSHRQTVRRSWQPSLECSNDVSPLGVAPSRGHEESFLCLVFLSPVSLLGRQTARAAGRSVTCLPGPLSPRWADCLGAAASLGPRLPGSAAWGPQCHGPGVPRREQRPGYAEPLPPLSTRWGPWAPGGRRATPAGGTHSSRRVSGRTPATSTQARGLSSSAPL